MNGKEQDLNPRGNDIHEALNDHESKIEQHLGALRQEFTDIAPSVKEFVEKHPIGTAAAALGVGIVAGYLISGGQRRVDSDGASILSSALNPAIEAVKDHLEQRIGSPSTSDHRISSQPGSIDTSEEKWGSGRDSERVEHRVHPHPNSSALNQLIELLVPIGIEIGLKALDKNGRADKT